MKKILLFLVLIAVLLNAVSCDGASKIDFDEIVENRPQNVEESKPSVYTVTFQANGGTKVEPIESETLTVPPSTTKEGYDFAGWYLDSALTQSAMFPMNITENIVLYAKWEIKQYNVIFHSNGGTPVNNILTDVLQSGPRIEKEGYDFQGWYLDFSFTEKAVFPLYLNKTTNLFAKWLKKYDVVAYDALKIKKGTGYSESKKIDITPKNLDLDELAAQGYYVNITVSYDVRYKKDYDVPLDIGYFGAPKHEIYLYRNNGVVRSEENIKTPSESTRKTITYTEKAYSIKDATLYFEVSTNNIQNIIYFDNIMVTYECTR